jgi:hypothetical protein
LTASPGKFDRVERLSPHATARLKRDVRLGDYGDMTRPLEQRGDRSRSCSGLRVDDRYIQRNAAKRAISDRRGIHDFIASRFDVS